MLSDAWMESLSKLIEPLPPPTEAECHRTVNMGRLARALEEMVEAGIDAEDLEEAVGWHQREDFERLLRAWESRASSGPTE